MEYSTLFFTYIWKSFFKVGEIMGEGNLCQTAQEVSRVLRISDEGGAVNKFI